MTGREQTPCDRAPTEMSEVQHNALLEATVMPEPDLTGLHFHIGREQACCMVGCTCPLAAGSSVYCDFHDSCETDDDGTPLTRHICESGRGER